MYSLSSPRFRNRVCLINNLQLPFVFRRRTFSCLFSRIFSNLCSFELLGLWTNFSILPLARFARSSVDRTTAQLAHHYCLSTLDTLIKKTDHRWKNVVTSGNELGVVNLVLLAGSSNFSGKNLEVNTTRYFIECVKSLQHSDVRVLKRLFHTLFWSKTRFKTNSCRFENP